MERFLLSNYTQKMGSRVLRGLSNGMQVRRIYLISLILNELQNFDGKCSFFEVQFNR